MATFTELELNSQVAAKILSGGRATTAFNTRELFNNLLASYLNLKDGGFEVEVETGYSTLVTLTDAKAFVHKSYVDGLVPDISGLVPYTGATSDINLNAKNITNVTIIDQYTALGQGFTLNPSGLRVKNTLDGESNYRFDGFSVADPLSGFNIYTYYRNDSIQINDNATPANDVSFEFPTNKAGTTQTFAMLSDLQNSAIESITAGENLVLGDLVYLKTDGKYWKADYLDESMVSTELRYVLGTITANATGSAQITGNVTSSGLTVGERYCVGINGAIVLESAIPDTDGIFVRYVGTAESATDLFFNPESTYIEVTLTPPSGTAGINRLIENRSGVTATIGSAVLTDYVQNCTGTNTLTLPTAIGNNNKYTVTLISGTTTINTTGGQTINGSSSITMVLAYLSYDFISDGSNWIIR